MGEGFSWLEEVQNGLMKINLRQVFMPSAVLVIAGPIELFPDNRQLTLWSSCSTTISLSCAVTFGEPRRGPPSTGQLAPMVQL